MVDTMKFLLMQAERDGEDLEFKIIDYEYE
jgi:hypothetical protein